MGSWELTPDPNPCSDRQGGCRLLLLQAEPSQGQELSRLQGRVDSGPAPGAPSYSHPPHSSCGTQLSRHDRYGKKRRCSWPGLGQAPQKPSEAGFPHTFIAHKDWMQRPTPTSSRRDRQALLCLWGQRGVAVSLA